MRRSSRAAAFRGSTTTSSPSFATSKIAKKVAHLSAQTEVERPNIKQMSASALCCATAGASFA